MFLFKLNYLSFWKLSMNWPFSLIDRSTNETEGGGREICPRRHSRAWREFNTKSSDAVKIERNTKGREFDWRAEGRESRQSIREHTQGLHVKLPHREQLVNHSYAIDFCCFNLPLLFVTQVYGSMYSAHAAKFRLSVKFNLILIWLCQESGKVNTWIK